MHDSEFENHLRECTSEMEKTKLLEGRELELADTLISELQSALATAKLLKLYLNSVHKTEEKIDMLDDILLNLANSVMATEEALDIADAVEG